MLTAGAFTAVLGGVLKKNTSYTRTQSVLASAAVITLVGFVKEMMHPVFDPGDILANGIGTAAGAGVLTVYFHFE